MSDSIIIDKVTGSVPDRKPVNYKKGDTVKIDDPVFKTYYPRQRYKVLQVYKRPKGYATQVWVKDLKTGRQGGPTNRADFYGKVTVRSHSRRTKRGVSRVRNYRRSR